MLEHNVHTYHVNIGGRDGGRSCLRGHAGSSAKKLPHTQPHVMVNQNMPRSQTPNQLTNQTGLYSTTPRG